MTQTISRLYTDPANAEAAIADLKQAGFDHDLIHHVTPGHDPDETRAAILRAGNFGLHARHFAERLGQGDTLVSFQAPFGRAALATRILERHGPAKNDLGEQGYDHPPRDPAAPLSSALGWNVLLHDPAPLSALLGLKVLSNDKPIPKRTTKLIDDPAPLSHAINAPLLTERPAILSDRAGWPVLSENPAPLSNKLGWQTLTREQTPPARRFGLSLISNDPAPFSRLLGLKLLSNDPAPLSHLLGWRIKSTDPKQTHTPTTRT